MGSVASPVCLRMPSVNGRTDGDKPTSGAVHEDRRVMNTLGTKIPNNKSFGSNSNGISGTKKFYRSNDASSLTPKSESIRSCFTIQQHPNNKKECPIKLQEKSRESKFLQEEVTTFSGITKTLMTSPKISPSKDVEAPNCNRITSCPPNKGRQPSPEPMEVAETIRYVEADCEDHLKKLHQINRRHDHLFQRMHRIQTKSGVEVAYSELKQIVLKGQEIFRIPCLMNKSGQMAAQLAHKDKTTSQRRFNDRDNSRLKRDCATYEALIASSEKLCDSSATESSSEEEELPEKVEIFNGRRNLTPFRYSTRNSSSVSRHPSWRWSKSRASIGAKWTWLQAQVSELEYRIRQQHELCRQLKNSKQPCLVYPQLKDSEDSRCARVIPINEHFRKRRLIVPQRVSPNASSSSQLDALNASCDCGSLYPKIELCVRCSLLHAQSGRERLDQIENRQLEETFLAKQLIGIPSAEVQSENFRLSQLDDSFHTVLSSKEDISLSLHYESLLRTGYNAVVNRNAAIEGAEIVSKKKKDIKGSEEDSQQNSSSAKRKRHSTQAAMRVNKLDKKANATMKVPDHHSKKRKTERRGTMTSKRSLSVDSQEQMDDDFITEFGEKSLSSRSRKTSHSTQQENSYDIDNIVIPYGMMSCTRLTERLKYKEILTPKWRVVDVASESTPSSSPVIEDANHEKSDPSITEEIQKNAQESNNKPIEPKNEVDVTCETKVEERSETDALTENSDETITEEFQRTEDVSEENFEIRHKKQELLEKERFTIFPKPKSALTNQGSFLNSGGIVRSESTESKTKEILGNSTSTLKAKDIHDESTFDKDDSMITMESGKAKRQHRTFSQEWTTFESSPSPTPYTPRCFPLSISDFDAMLADNPIWPSAASPSM